MYLVEFASTDTVGAYTKTREGLIASKTDTTTDKPKFAKILQVGDETDRYKVGELVMLVPTTRDMFIKYDDWEGSLIPEGDIIGSLNK